METNIFVHFGPNTFTDKEWGGGNEDPNLFNPIHLNCDQWVKTFKAAGFKGVIITAKHHDGFCLWPSKYSTHTVAQSAWKNGKGDVLRELSDACHRYGLKFGVYLSPWDRNHPSYGTPEYNHIFASMLQEVLTHYGQVFEVWFDGANGEGPNGKKQVYDWDLFHSVVYKYQPNAIIFSDGGPGTRWVGNEEGIASETSWSMIPKGRYLPGTPYASELGEGNENGDDWVPPECDVSIRPGWFYHPEQEGQNKSPETLLNLYEKSVGRNGQLLLNVPPNREGLLTQGEQDSLLGFHELVKRIYGRNLAASAHAEATGSFGPGYGPENVLKSDGKFWAANPSGIDEGITLHLSTSTTFDRCVLSEPIAYGQRVSLFKIEAMTGDQWQTIAKGTTIGHKRILSFPPVTAEAVRVVIQQSRDTPALSEFGLYNSGMK
jgi:alpha-L-fucosidase